MKNKVIYFAMFVAGVVIGSASTMQYFKTKYEKIAEEEIKSVKEALYSKEEKIIKEYKNEDISKDDETTEEEYDEDFEEDYEEYETLTKDYASFSKKEKEEEKVIKKPYVIPPEEFGEKDDYECISLMYYSNNVLTNELDEVIEGKELDALIGKDSLSHFGEYEDDSVFVRNDKLKTDFEILRDNCPFLIDMQ